MRRLFSPAFAALFAVSTLAAIPPPAPLPLWPGPPPGAPLALPAESDTTKPQDGLVAGQRVTRIANVTTPTLAVYRADPDHNSGACVVVCPGGGYKILAMDLEGSEVAAWLNRIGVTAVVLKYRVPSRPDGPIWLAAVQDAQRAISTARTNAAQWRIDPARIGICGFSAGGFTAGLASLFEQDRKYPAADPIDAASCRPDFALLIYPSNFVEAGSPALMPGLSFARTMPPAFIVQTDDDPVSPLNALFLAAEMAKVKAPVELHLYARGGHGYGVRPVANEPCTTWPSAAEVWLRRTGWLGRSN